MFETLFVLLPSLLIGAKGYYFRLWKQFFTNNDKKKTRIRDFMKTWRHYPFARWSKPIVANASSSVFRGNRMEPSRKHYCSVYEAGVSQLPVEVWISSLVLDARERILSRPCAMHALRIRIVVEKPPRSSWEKINYLSCLGNPRMSQRPHSTLVLITVSTARRNWVKREVRNKMDFDEASVILGNQRNRSSLTRLNKKSTIQREHPSNVKPSQRSALGSPSLMRGKTAVQIHPQLAELSSCESGWLRRAKGDSFKLRTLAGT